MITGTVTDDEATVRLVVKGSSGKMQEVRAVIDTGYTASLSLPPDVIAALDLPWQSFDRAILADGSECLFDVFETEVDWDGEVRQVLVHEADAEPLIGMSLLRGFELKVQVRRRGKVTIKRLPTR